MTLSSGLISNIVNKRGGAVAGDLAQATTALQPIQDWIRGWKGAYFGIDASERMASILPGTIANGWQMFAAVRPVSAPSSTGIVMVGASGGQLSVSGAGSWPASAVINANVALTYASAFQPGKPHVLMGIGGAGGDLHLDGVSVVTPTSTGSRQITTPLTFGGSNTGTSRFSGVLAEPILGVAMSGSEIAALEAAQTAKYHTQEPGITVMRVGDSVGYGTGDTASPPGGTRKRVWDQRLGSSKLAGRWIESIGPLTDARWSDDAHDCVSGKGIVYHTSDIPARIGSGHQYNPDVFLVLAWAASLRELAPETYVAGTGPGTTCQAAIDFCVATLLGAVPTARLVLGNLIDCNPAGDATYSARRAVWNALLVLTIIPAIQAATGKAVVLCDYAGAMGAYNAANYADTYHPNGAGYDRMASAEVDALIRVAALT
jgi:hypothetical protein